MRILLPLLLLLMAMALTGCPGPERELMKVQPPEVVDKIVVEYRDLPKWATEQMPNEPPEDGSVNALKNANNARAATIDYVNCRSRVLAKVDQGEDLDPKKVCKK